MEHTWMNGAFLLAAVFFCVCVLQLSCQLSGAGPILSLFWPYFGTIFGLESVSLVPAAAIVRVAFGDGRAPTTH